MGNSLPHVSQYAQKSPLTGSVDLTGVLQAAILFIAACTLAGLVGNLMPMHLGELMALSLAPLLGFEVLYSNQQLRPVQAVLSVGLGCGGAVAAVALGGSGAELVLTSVIVLCGLAVMLAVMLRLQENEALLAGARRHAKSLDAANVNMGGVAHDINNLLTVIQGSAELLQLHSNLDDVALSDTARILDAVERAHVLGQKMASAGTEPSPMLERVELTSQVRKLSDLLAPLGLHAHVHHQLPPAPVHIRASHGALERILMNLISNAGRANSHNIQIRVDVLAEQVVLSVVDDGVGMTADVLHQAQRRLFTTCAQKGGTGLGLFTVRQLVNEMGGTLAIDSQEGRGTAVSLFLPVEN